MEILEGYTTMLTTRRETREGDCFCSPANTSALSNIPISDPSLKGRRGETAGGEGRKNAPGVARKIIPLCPFAKHEFDNTREYDDIRA